MTEIGSVIDGKYERRAEKITIFSAFFIDKTGSLMYNIMYIMADNTHC